MKTGIIASLDETTKGLLQTIMSFSPTQLNEVPFEGSWTAAQVAEHILKAETGFSNIWQGHTEETKRPVDKNVPVIESIFLDFSTKLKSPDFIIPAEGWHDKEKLYDEIKDNRAKIKQLAESVDLTQTFTEFQLPKMGCLTGVEGATFIICHSKRHIHQMKHIYEKVVV